MQSNNKINNNESFKLLNLSDDDKSSELPDLDLPEISLQRKRKVKRYGIRKLDCMVMDCILFVFF